MAVGPGFEISSQDPCILKEEFDESLSGEGEVLCVYY